MKIVCGPLMAAFLAVGCVPVEDLSTPTPTPMPAPGSQSAVDSGTQATPMNPPDAMAPLSGDTSRLRVVHASPDAPRVDVYAEGVVDPIVKGIAYGDTSATLDLPAGTYNV